jgi:hypothetical protein
MNEPMYRCPECHEWVRSASGSDCTCTPKQEYQAPKHHVVVGTIGHGKELLTATLNRVGKQLMIDEASQPRLDPKLLEAERIERQRVTVKEEYGARARYVEQPYKPNRKQRRAQASMRRQHPKGKKP